MAKYDLTDEDVRIIADFRYLHVMLGNVFDGISRERRKYTDEQIVALAKLINVRDALEKSEAISGWLRQIYQQVAARDAA